MIISFRQIFAAPDLNEKLKALRQRRYFTDENIKTSKEKLSNAKDEDEYRQILDHIRTLEINAAQIADDIEQLESPTYWRAQQLEDIKKYGFSLSGHAVDQYNSRFLPYLTREQLIEFLKKLGLKEKMGADKTHQIIQMKPNFRVTVEHGIVTTLKYDEDYYHGGREAKFNLGAI